jgi:acetate kinase
MAALMLVLALNSGSSSLKCAVVDPEARELRQSALVENLGTSQARMVLVAPTGKQVIDLAHADHSSALEVVLEHFRLDAELWRALRGVGHRVVHGGEAFTESALIDGAVERSIEQCQALAPLHNPANLLGIRAARRALPDLPHVAVFDTAFHQTLPDVAFRYAVPESWYREHGVRRYGFHGTSHRYVAGEAATRLGKPLSELNLLTAHLGNGCSAAAIAGGRCVDTTMGFTPLEGLVMGTRSGDIDPALIFHLANHVGLPLATIERALNKESGLLGLSGLTHDMRTLTIEAEHHEGARLAIEVFCHRLAKYLGALRTSFERLDAIIFTGGIGEHSALVRRLVCQRLVGLGVVLDPDKNDTALEQIEGPSSQIALLVIPTNEELMIARDTLAITSGRRA